MKRAHVALGVFVSSALMAAFAVGCGDGVETRGTDGSGGEGGGTSAQGSSVLSSVASSTSMGGLTGDGNDSCEQAKTLKIGGNVLSGDLDPTGDSDFFKFEGKAGQALYFGTGAESLDDVRFDPVYIDTILTLYDANQTQIAESNDSYPTLNADSGLYVILPADGAYCLRVTECWTWASDPKQSCLEPQNKDAMSYKLLGYELDPDLDSVVEDAEKGDDAVSASVIGYNKSNSGIYYYSEVYGTFNDKTDVDVFSFSLPADIPYHEGTRSVANFYIQPSGNSGDGSSSPVGRLYVVDPVDPLVPLAEIYGAQNTRLAPWLKTEKDYLLFVEHPSLAYETNDYYFIVHFGSHGNPVETDNIGNDSVMGAEALKVESNGVGRYSAFLEGDLAVAPIDVDHFKVAVPGGAVKITVACFAQRIGSGLEEFTLALLASNGTALPPGNVIATETASNGATVTDVAIPVNTKEIVLKLTAQQSPSISSSFYRCGVHFYAP